MKRRITPCSVTAKPVSVNDLADVFAWLQQKAIDYRLDYLLAHTDDGVVWGRLDGTTLRTSYEAAKEHQKANQVCPPLLTGTLQQARLFAEQAELLLWRDSDGGWQARLIRDTNGDELPLWTEAFDEPQVLWGTSHTTLLHNFTLWTEGAQGLRYALPVTGVVSLEISYKDGRNIPRKRQETYPPRLKVRHYLGREDVAGVAASRLVGFETKWEKQA